MNLVYVFAILINTGKKIPILSRELMPVHSIRKTFAESFSQLCSQTSDYCVVIIWWGKQINNNNSLYFPSDHWKGGILVSYNHLKWRYNILNSILCYLPLVPKFSSLTVLPSSNLEPDLSCPHHQGPDCQSILRTCALLWSMTFSFNKNFQTNIYISSTVIFLSWHLVIFKFEI